MDKTIYVCTGSCGAVISEEEYKSGLTKCGTKSCNMYGHPFKKMVKCGKCGKILSPNEPHQD